MKRYDDRHSILGRAENMLVVTPSASELPEISRFIMVSVDDVTVTGILADMTTSFTTVPLKAGQEYNLGFKVISAVSAGTVQVFW